MRYRALAPALFLALAVMLLACGHSHVYPADAYGGYCRDSFGAWTICDGYYYDPVLHVVVNRYTAQPVYVSSRYQSQVYSGNYSSGAPNPNSLAPKGSVKTSTVRSSDGYKTQVKTSTDRNGGQVIQEGGSNKPSGNPNKSSGGSTNGGSNTGAAGGSCSGQNGCTGGGGAASNKSGGSNPPSQNSGGGGNPNKPSGGGGSTNTGGGSSGGPPKPAGPPPASGPGKK